MKPDKRRLENIPIVGDDDEPATEPLLYMRGLSFLDFVPVAEDDVVSVKEARASIDTLQSLCIQSEREAF